MFCCTSNLNSPTVSLLWPVVNGKGKASKLISVRSVSALPAHQLYWRPRGANNVSSYLR